MNAQISATLFLIQSDVCPLAVTCVRVTIYLVEAKVGGNVVSTFNDAHWDQDGYAI